MSTENRVSGLHLSDNQRICELKSLENATFCPSQFDHKKQQQNYCDLVGTIIITSLPCLNQLKDVAFKHIQHQYSKEMKQATNRVSWVIAHKKSAHYVLHQNTKLAFKI